MNSGIYKIANKITADSYIGSAVNLSNRFKTHKYALRHNNHSNSHLQNVFNKYGLDNLSFEIIEYVNNKNKLIEREQYYIDTLNPEYNIRKIANSNLGLTWKLSKSTKEKMSIAANNRSDTHRNNLSMSLKGKKKSKEHALKNGEVHSINFIIKSPTGKIIKGKNIRKFCRENNLSQSTVCKLLKGTIKKHRGWSKVN